MRKLAAKNYLPIAIFSFLAMFFCSATSTAQQEPIGRIRLTGTVKDVKSGSPLQSATITAITVRQAGQAKEDTVSSLSITDANGKFQLAVPEGSYSILSVSAIGFETLERRVNLVSDRSEINAGDFLLGSAATNLENVVVTAKKPLMTIGVDRRIFNADAAITSKGGNAVDLMRNIPSLSVDINGNVQLRNSSPQIFVNGRPTILTLEQIPSDDIDRVEVITNPSSRYDAGSTGGIINIILKKNRKAGLNGVATIGAGSPELLNGNLSLNYRKGRANFFASGNYNRSGGIARGEAKRQNKKGGIITDYFTQDSERDRQRLFYSGRFGMDYMFNDFNSITISQGFVDGNFDNEEIQRQSYFDARNSPTRTGTRTANDRFGFNRSNTQVNYRKTFEKPEKEWTADFTYSGGRNSGDAAIVNEFFNLEGELNGDPVLVRNFSDGNGRQFTLQTDYVNPFSETGKFELGARSYHNISRDKLDVFSVNGNNFTKLPLSNNYRFREMINAIYGNYSNKYKKLGYQAGLRIEQSSFRGELLDSARSFGYDYPSRGKNIWNAFFPSLYLSYELSEGNDLQVNFSRRIRRPNFWQINPYVDITDPMNIRKGNPELQPEFTNSFELNYNRTFNTGNLLISGYFRNNTEDITTYSDTISTAQLQDLDNAAIDPNAILTTFINADRTNRMGLELTWQQRIGNNFDFTPNFNAQYRDVKATVNNRSLGNTGFNWNFKLMANYKFSETEMGLLKNLSFQLSGEYESPRVMTQGRDKEQYYVDFAIRKDFLKDKAGTLTFNVNDLFNSRRFGNITDTENFYQDSYRRWNVRTVRLSFSYRFGKKDFDLFKKRERNGENGEEDRG